MSTQTTGSRGSATPTVAGTGCAGCLADAVEVNYSVKHDARLCLTCHVKAALLSRQVELVLSDEPRSRADVARDVGRNPRDGSVGRALKRLCDDGRAVRDGDGYSEASPTGCPQPRSLAAPPTDAVRPDRPAPQAPGRGRSV